MLTLLIKTIAESDDLVPEEGVDERYDEVMSEIKALEKGLDKSLKKLEDGVGFVEFFCVLS